MLDREGLSLDPGPLLEELARSPDLQPFRELIEPLIVYDREHNSDLIRTLKVFFAANTNASEAAERLYLHRNSMNYRLARISSLVGRMRSHKPRRAARFG